MPKDSTPSHFALLRLEDSPLILETVSPGARAYDDLLSALRAQSAEWRNGLMTALELVAIQASARAILDSIANDLDEFKPSKNSRTSKSWPPSPYSRKILFGKPKADDDLKNPDAFFYHHASGKV